MRIYFKIITKCPACGKEMTIHGQGIEPEVLPDTHSSGFNCPTCGKRAYLHILAADGCWLIRPFVNVSDI